MSMTSSLWFSDILKSIILKILVGILGLYESYNLKDLSDERIMFIFLIRVNSMSYNYNIYIKEKCYFDFVEKFIKVVVNGSYKKI